MVSTLCDIIRIKMYGKQFFIASCLLLGAWASASTKKRGIFESAASFGGFGGGFHGFNAESSYNGLGSSAVSILPGSSGPAFGAYAKPVWIRPSVSPGEIAAAIQAAKEASGIVMDSQRRVQEAKESLLHQQHIASQKQAQAALALQKTEAAAAVQQQEAKSAATALVLAQQRLAQAKAEVAEHQRIAAAKEAQAAAIIQKSASIAAADIQRNDDAARKLNAVQHSGNEALRQAAASKDGNLSAASAAVAASKNSDRFSSFPWFDASSTKFINLQPWG